MHRITKIMTVCIHWYLKWKKRIVVKIKSISGNLFTKALKLTELVKILIAQITEINAVSTNSIVKILVIKSISRKLITE